MEKIGQTFWYEAGYILIEFPFCNSQFEKKKVHGYILLPIQFSVSTASHFEISFTACKGLLFLFGKEQKLTLSFIFSS